MSTDSSEDFLRFGDFCSGASAKIIRRNSFLLTVTGGIAECPVSVVAATLDDMDIDALCHVQFAAVQTIDEVRTAELNTDGCDILFISSSSEENDIHPGYARLYRNKTRSDDSLLRRSDVMESFSAAGFNFDDSPALKFAGELFDVVPYITCPVWPAEAAEWKDRVRTQNWPTPALIEKCVNNGCGFVSAVHGNTRTELIDFEFRYSFSLAEMQLLRSWLPIQKRIYGALKYLHKFSQQDVDCSRRRLLKSYHVKTLMLWSVEQKLSAFWSDGRFKTSVIELLRELIECLKDRKLCHYFIPANNLFDHLATDNEVDRCISDLVTTAKSYENGQLSLKRDFGGMSDCPILRRLVVWFLCLPQVLPVKNPRKMSPTIIYELNNIFCALSILRDGMLLKQQTSGSCSESCSITVESAFLAARSEHAGVCNIVLNDKDVVTALTSNVVICETFNRRLSPATWRRELTGVVGNGLNSADSELPLRGDQEHDGIVRGLFSKLLQNCRHLYGTTRPSWLLAQTYYSNYQYVACKQYSKAIDICNEVLSQEYSKRTAIIFAWLMPLSAEWSVIFDHEIQTILGLALLHDAARRRATESAAHTYSSDFRHVYIPIPPLIFLYYVRARCELHLLAEDVDKSNINASEINGRLRRVDETFRHAFNLDETYHINDKSITDMLKLFLGDVVRRHVAAVEMKCRLLC